MKEITEINADGTALRAAQMKMLDILIEIDRICKKHKLEYWIDFGTLLGAVRHGGFIPWDDDIDISMPSSSYKKFMEVASYELCGEYVLQTEKTEPSSMQGFGLYKVRMKGTLYIMGYDRMDKKYSKGLFVDIFESVSYPSINRKLYSFLVRRICKSFGFMIYNKELNFGNIVRYFVFPVEFAFFFIIWKFVCLFGKKEREYPAITRIIDGYPSLKSDIYPLTTIEFEGHAFSCPKNPHARLKEWCCDYMVVPPVEKRRMHAKFICIDTRNCFVGKE